MLSALFTKHYKAIRVIHWGSPFIYIRLYTIISLLQAFYIRGSIITLGIVQNALQGLYGRYRGIDTTIILCYAILELKAVERWYNND